MSGKKGFGDPKIILALFLVIIGLILIGVGLFKGKLAILVFGIILLGIGLRISE